MLKIKDNVDLKELEKYGFIKERYNVLYLFEENSFTRIRIEIETRRIGFYNSADIIVEKEILDKLYDLIKDGLVEKIDE